MLYGRIRRQIEDLIPLFGVDTQAPAILAAFDCLCHESLAFDIARRAPEQSRINADGTPFQFALSLRSGGRAPFQFLTEAGRPGCDMEERRRATYHSLERLGDVCGLNHEVQRLLSILQEIAPHADGGLAANASGLFWVALSFPQAAAPALTVYVNARYGPDSAQWRRLDQFAAMFAAEGRWRAVAARSASGLTPLGVAMTAHRGGPITGRAYVQAFGVALPVYRDLFVRSTSTPGAADGFDRFAGDLLGDDMVLPLGTSVFSIEVAGDPHAGAKFELCAHCAFADDAEAARRIANWLTRSGIGDEIYRGTMSYLAGAKPRLRGSPPSLHAYVGLGTHGADQYAAVYFNPGPALACA